MMMVASGIAVWWSVGAWDKLLAVRAEDIANDPERTQNLKYLLAGASFAGTSADLAAYAQAGQAWGVAAKDLAEGILSGRELCLALHCLAEGHQDKATGHVLASFRPFVARAEQTALLDLRLIELSRRAQPQDVVPPLPQADGQTARILQRQEIGSVMDLFPINNADGYGGFPFVESGSHFICAYYDDERRMTLASRSDDGTWDRVVLGQKVGWDSHNYIALEVDSEGVLHLCGNMHVSPLVYYRSDRPWDIHSMVQVAAMTGDRESHVTYPKFFFLNNGKLCFSYRDGKSGNGNILINVYTVKSRTWGRMSQDPVLDGEGLRNAYVYGPVQGPDGYFHSCWVWRGTINAETSHVLAYARSPDLIHWQDGLGQPLRLPMTYLGADTVADLPMGSGIINNNNLIGFDNSGHPLIAYHRFDDHGFTQIYLARRDVVGWQHQQVTQWTHRWEFAGNGSLSFEVTLFPPYALGDGKIAQEYEHHLYGRGALILEDEGLRPVAHHKGSLFIPPELSEQSEGGIKRNISFRWADMVTKPTFHVVSWKSHPENRDRASENAPIADNPLEVLKVERHHPDLTQLSATPETATSAPESADFLRQKLSDLQTQVHDLRFRLQAETHYRKEVESRFRKRR